MIVGPDSRSASDALDDHLLGAGLRTDLRSDLRSDLFTVVRGDLDTPGMGAVVLIDPACGGVGHGREWLCGWSLEWCHTWYSKEPIYPYNI